MLTVVIPYNRFTKKIGKSVGGQNKRIAKADGTYKIEKLGKELTRKADSTERTKGTSCKTRGGATVLINSESRACHLGRVDKNDKRNGLAVLPW